MVNMVNVTPLNVAWLTKLVSSSHNCRAMLKNLQMFAMQQHFSFYRPYGSKTIPRDQKIPHRRDGGCNGENYSDIPYCQ